MDQSISLRYERDIQQKNSGQSWNTENIFEQKTLLTV